MEQVSLKPRVLLALEELLPATRGVVMLYNVDKFPTHLEVALPIDTQQICAELKLWGHDCVTMQSPFMVSVACFDRERLEDQPSHIFLYLRDGATEDEKPIIH